jgi:hypothetical protein
MPRTVPFGRERVRGRPPKARNLKTPFEKGYKPKRYSRRGGGRGGASHKEEI